MDSKGKAAALSLVVSVLSACGGSSGSGTQTTPLAVNSTPQSVDVSAHFVYATNSVSNNISAYSIDSQTGGLIAVSGSPFVAGTKPAAMTFSPSGARLYVSNAGSNDVSAYSIGSTGALAAAAGSPFALSPVTTPVGVPVSAAVIDPTGKFALVTNGSAPEVQVISLFTQPDNLFLYGIDSQSGALQLPSGSPYMSSGLNPVAATFDTAGAFAYVLNEIRAIGSESTSVDIYRLDAANSALVHVGSPLIGPNRTGGPGVFAHFLALDPSGKFLYVTCNSCGNGDIGFHLDGAGGATLVDPTGPMAYGKITSQSFVSISSGVYAISLATSSLEICANKLDPTTGSLTQVNCAALPSGSVASGANDNALAVDPLGKFVLVTNPALNTVSVFNIDAATGTLSAVSGSSFATGTGPSAVAVDAKGSVVYVANGGSNDISAYLLNRTTGALTAISGSPFVAGSTPTTLALH